MKKPKLQSRELARQVAFAPALTPLEAAMLPARPAPRRGALSMARAAFAPGAPRRQEGIRLPRLLGWGPHRQNI